jgi:hypothetical protein
MASVPFGGARAQGHGRPLARIGALPGWLIVFAATALPYFALGWYLATVADVFDGDAVSRTAQAAYVILGRDPHLAAIGFIWNPLPSLLQIPLVVLLAPFGQIVLAGPIQSAICMAGAAALLWQFMGDYRLARSVRIAFLTLFVANPMIILYAANGMSEAMFLFFLIGLVRAFSRWAIGGQPLSLVWAALMTAGAFGVRYEALPVAAAGAAAVLLVLLTARDHRWPKIEATLLVFLTPFCYAVALWLFFNWLIVGDPFYFQQSVYSNEAQTALFAATSNYLSAAVSAPVASFTYAASRFVGLFPAFALVALGTVALACARRSWALLGPLAIFVAVPAFHVYVIYSGASWGWLRFFMYNIPATFLLAVPLIDAARATRFRRMAEWLLVAAFLASSIVGLGLMRDPNYGRQEQYFLGRLTDRNLAVPESRSNDEAEAVAAWIEQELPGQRILLDTVRGYGVWLYAEHRERYIIVSDRDYAAILVEPRGQADYLLVPSPQVEAADSINTRYPTLYAAGAPGLTLVRDFGGEVGWRLFRIASPLP